MAGASSIPTTSGASTIGKQSESSEGTASGSPAAARAEIFGAHALRAERAAFGQLLEQLRFDLVRTTHEDQRTRSQDPVLAGVDRSLDHGFGSVISPHRVERYSHLR
jgi:hypothetical protein